MVDPTTPKKQVSYGDLTKGKRIEKHLDKQPPGKAVSDFTISGKPIQRTDAVEKVTGKARYAGDISLPGMLYARIVRPPAHGAKLTDSDTSAAAKSTRRSNRKRRRPDSGGPLVARQGREGLESHTGEIQPTSDQSQ